MENTNLNLEAGYQMSDPKQFTYFVFPDIDGNLVEVVVPNQ